MLGIYRLAPAAATRGPPAAPRCGEAPGVRGKTWSPQEPTVAAVLVVVEKRLQPLGGGRKRLGARRGLAHVASQGDEFLAHLGCLDGAVLVAPNAPPEPAPPRCSERSHHSTQCATRCARNSSTAMPSPPTRSVRFGLNAAAKAAMPAGRSRVRPLLTSIATSRRPTFTTKSTSRPRSRQ